MALTMEYKQNDSSHGHAPEYFSMPPVSICPLEEQHPERILGPQGLAESQGEDPGSPSHHLEEKPLALLERLTVQTSCEKSPSFGARLI